MELYLSILSNTHLVFWGYVVMIGLIFVCSILNRGKKKLVRSGSYRCGTCFGNGHLQEERTDTRVIDGVRYEGSYSVNGDVCPSCKGSKVISINGGWYAIFVEAYRSFIVALAFWSVLRWLPRTWFDSEIVNHYGVTIFLWMYTAAVFRIGEHLCDFYSRWFFPLLVILPFPSLWLLWKIAFLPISNDFYYLISLPVFGGLSLFISVQLYKMNHDILYDPAKTYIQNFN